LGVEDAIARRATALLLAVAGGDINAAVLYDDLLFPLLFETARRRGRWMARDAAQRLSIGSGSMIAVPTAGEVDLEEVAAVASERALARARGSALRFDAERGDGASWALGALGLAYVDALRELSRSRRHLQELPMEDLPDRSRYGGQEGYDPQDIVVTRDALERALGALTEQERFVVLGRYQYGLSYREMAAYLFEDESATKRVDRLLQTARVKLEGEQARWVSGE
jgi:DNA-directed RNA polymerase specialized sigma24 family protein